MANAERKEQFCKKASDAKVDESTLPRCSVKADLSALEDAYNIKGLERIDGKVLAEAIRRDRCRASTTTVIHHPIIAQRSPVTVLRRRCSEDLRACTQVSNTE